MLKSFLRDRLLLVLLSLALLIRLLAFFEPLVERWYSLSLYPLISTFLRALLGWIPFSLGDVLYIVAGIYLVVKTFFLFQSLFQRRLGSYLTSQRLRKLARLILLVYVAFNLLWGLNYNRQGIAAQLNLQVRSYDSTTLQQLTLRLRDRLEALASSVDSIDRNRLQANRVLFGQAHSDYAKAALSYPFLKYRFRSIKASLYGSSGKYFGYTGYYNPFTGEAQLKTSIPVFLKSFVVNHEVAHQLGYAKENEASFVSYLVSKQSDNVYVRYSAYYELFFDAFYELLQMGNREFARTVYLSLSERVKADRREEVQYLRRSSNAVEPFMSKAYDRYLKLNNQPKGKATYNEVIAWLIAYQSRYGASAL